jgi:hypothetical protein
MSMMTGSSTVNFSVKIVSASFESATLLVKTVSRVMLNNLDNILRTGGGIFSFHVISLSRSIVNHFLLGDFAFRIRIILGHCDSRLPTQGDHRLQDTSQADSSCIFPEAAFPKWSHLWERSRRTAAQDRPIEDNQAQREELFHFMVLLIDMVMQSQKYYDNLLNESCLNWESGESHPKSKYHLIRSGLA